MLLGRGKTLRATIKTEMDLREKMKIITRSSREFARKKQTLLIFTQT